MDKKGILELLEFLKQKILSSGIIESQKEHLEELAKEKEKLQQTNESLEAKINNDSNYEVESKVELYSLEDRLSTRRKEKTEVLQTKFAKENSLQALNTYIDSRRTRLSEIEATIDTVLEDQKEELQKEQKELEEEISNLNKEAENIKKDISDHEYESKEISKELKELTSLIASYKDGLNKKTLIDEKQRDKDQKELETDKECMEHLLYLETKYSYDFIKELEKLMSDFDYNVITYDELQSKLIEYRQNLPITAVLEETRSTDVLRKEEEHEVPLINEEIALLTAKLDSIDNYELENNLEELERYINDLESTLKNFDSEITSEEDAKKELEQDIEQGKEYLQAMKQVKAQLQESYKVLGVDASEELKTKYELKLAQTEEWLKLIKDGLKYDESAKKHCDTNIKNLTKKLEDYAAIYTQFKEQLGKQKNYDFVQMAKDKRRLNELNRRLEAYNQTHEINATTILEQFEAIQNAKYEPEVLSVDELIKDIESSEKGLVYKDCGENKALASKAKSKSFIQKIKFWFTSITTVLLVAAGIVKENPEAKEHAKELMLNAQANIIKAIDNDANKITKYTYEQLGLEIPEELLNDEETYIDSKDLEVEPVGTISEEDLTPVITSEESLDDVVANIELAKEPVVVPTEVEPSIDDIVANIELAKEPVEVSTKVEPSLDDLVANIELAKEPLEVSTEVEPSLDDVVANIELAKEPVVSTELEPSLDALVASINDVSDQTTSFDLKPAKDETTSKIDEKNVSAYLNSITTPASSIKEKAVEEVKDDNDKWQEYREIGYMENGEFISTAVPGKLTIPTSDGNSLSFNLKNDNEDEIEYLEFPGEKVKKL